MVHDSLTNKVLLLGSSGFVGSSLRDEIKHDSDVWHHATSARTQPNSGLHSWNVLEICTLPPTYNLIVHAATPASAELNAKDPSLMYDLNVIAMNNVIDFAARHQQPPVVLFTSSGAVYGDLPLSLEAFAEDWPVATVSSELSSAYARGKIEAERILQEATKAGKCIGLIARMFAFSGVYLPLDKHFAIGNFVRDVVQSRAITIRSDGSSIRSYMDGKDMASWLLRIIDAGSPDEIYHVGSERSISIRDLATLVSKRYQLITNNEASIEILAESSPLDGVSRYIPSTKWTRERLNLKENVSLEASVDQMIIKALHAR
jgi:dTDP-glucose 4,6-dehydratase